MDWWPGRDLPVISSYATWGKFQTSGMEKQRRRWMDVWFEQKSCVDSRTLCQDADWMKFLPHVSTTLGFVWKVKLVSLCFLKLLRLLAKYYFQSVCAGWLYLGYLWCRKKEGHFGLSFDQIWLSPVFRYYFWPIKIVMGQTELRNWRMGVSCKAALLKCHNLSNSAKF